MEAILVNRPLTITEENEIRSLLKQDETTTLYCNVAVCDELNENSAGPLDISPEQKREINYSTMDKVIQFGEYSSGDASVTDLLSFENISLWHYHKFRIYFAIRNLQYEVELINMLALKFDELHVYTDNTLLAQYPIDHKNINLHVNRRSTSTFNYLAAFKYLVFFKLRFFLGFFQLRKTKQAKHVVIDHALKQTNLNLNSLQPEQGNYNLQYLFYKLNEDFIILDDVEIPKFQKGVKFKIDGARIKTGKSLLFGEYVLGRGILSASLRKKLTHLTTLFKEHLSALKEKTSDPVFFTMITLLESLHSSSKLFIFKYLAYQRFFSNHSFKSVASIDENSPRIKSILDAAKSQKITTIGIQHGTIHELHPAYIYSREDQKRMIVPDYTMVWGQFWKEFLIEKGNYKPESLIVTGQIRTDIIPRLSGTKPSEYLNLPKDKKVIVFASQPQRDAKLREKAAMDVFTAISGLQNTHLVVKLHPAENNDFDYYHKLAKKVGCTNYQIVLQFDLYLLISLCDILITCFSTVGAETVYFGKPLIILDHLKQDIQGYHREGIAFQATNKDELEHYLQEILTGKLTPDREVYKKYISKYAYHIDGKVADRIIKFIRNL